MDILLKKQLYIILLSLTILSCPLNNTVKIGVSVELTGIFSEYGVEVRDGVTLAVEEQNEKGGIKGQKLELLIRDDHGSKTEAPLIDSELHKEGVYAIIGHITSSVTEAAVPIANRSNIPLISSTSAAENLSGKDDYFFRTPPSAADLGYVMAKYIYNERKIRKLHGLISSENRAFVQPYWKSFTETFESYGGEIMDTMVISKDFRNQETILETVEHCALDEDHSEFGIITVLPSAALAYISQQIRIAEIEISLFSSSWGYTDNLISMGGRAVEGLELAVQYSISPGPELLKFNNIFRERFDREPQPMAYEAYDLANILFNALEKCNLERPELKQALISTGTYKGTDSEIKLDSYGDAIRTINIITIREGEFTEVKSYPPDMQH